MSDLFISDLHLSAERPEINNAFSRFLTTRARGASTLYILGDLFDYWVGDDQLDHDPLSQAVARELAELHRHGTAIFLMHGNRDFLVGERFAREAHCTILNDPTTITLGTTTTMLMHGDTLCTEDIAYQQFREMVRAPAWQLEWLSQPYATRDARARGMRSRSDSEKSLKADAIMDVEAAAVVRAFEASQATTIIHGHTHRPAKHTHAVANRTCTRWVLPDWHKGWCGLEWDGTKLATIHE